MNKLLRYLPAAAVAVTLFAACDNVDEKDRFIPVERPEVKRVVLISEFTGMSCVNCPTGAAAVHNVVDLYPDNVVVVALHPENNINTTPIGGLDLRCPLATQYEAYFKPNAFPAAQINFGAVSYEPSLWGTEAIAALDQAAALDLTVTADYNAETRELTARAEGTFNRVLTAEMNILLLVTENGIKGFQKDKDKGMIAGYIHNHVLRGSLNGTWGQSVGTSFVTEQKVEAEGSITLAEKWVPDNCEVIAVALQAGSKAVEQAASAPVVPAADNEE